VEEGQPIRVAYPVPSAPILVAATPIPETSITSSFVQPDGTRVTEIKNTDGTSTVIRETPRIQGGSEYQPLAPTGRFRNGMCDCFEVLCSGRFWVSVFECDFDGIRFLLSRHTDIGFFCHADGLLLYRLLHGADYATIQIESFRCTRQLSKHVLDLHSCVHDHCYSVVDSDGFGRCEL
jgi:hypothetical protein